VYPSSGFFLALQAAENVFARETFPMPKQSRKMLMAFIADEVWLC
jgi:hypothetical protein